MTTHQEMSFLVQWWNRLWLTRTDNSLSESNKHLQFTLFSTTSLRKYVYACEDGLLKSRFLQTTPKVSNYIMEMEIGSRRVRKVLPTFTYSNSTFFQHFSTEGLDDTCLLGLSDEQMQKLKALPSDKADKADKADK